MRVLYLTWGEVPRLSSVYGGQAVRVVAELQRHPKVESASLVAGYPVIHSGMVREKWKYNQQLRSISSIVGADNFATRRIPVPPVGVHPKPWQLRFFTSGHHEFLARQIRARCATVVQCRSYVATHFSLETRALFNMNFKIIFDARSLMPEEGVLMGRWTLSSAAYAFWKKREAGMLAEADLTTAVSQPMKERFDRIGARRSALVHLSVDIGDLDEKKISDNSRLDDGVPLIAYCGYLAEDTWHSPTCLWEVFESFRSHCPGARLLVITKSDHAMLRDSLKLSGKAELLDAIRFTSAASPADVVHLLQEADLSVLSYRNPVSTFEKDLSEPVFATKTAEYLAVGLPLICNRYCGGARDYALRLDAGIAYDPEYLLSQENVSRLLRQSRERLRISRAARGDFGLVENAQRLVHLFEELPSPTEQALRYGQAGF